MTDLHDLHDLHDTDLILKGSKEIKPLIDYAKEAILDSLEDVDYIVHDVDDSGCVFVGYDTTTKQYILGFNIVCEDVFDVGCDEYDFIDSDDYEDHQYDDYMDFDDYNCTFLISCTVRGVLIKDESETKWINVDISPILEGDFFESIFPDLSSNILQISLDHN